MSTQSPSTPAPSTTESLRAVRELEREISDRLAAARASSELTDRAAAEARRLRERAAAEARELADRRTAELLAEAERQAAALRAAGERRAARLTAAAAARLEEDVADLLALVAPGTTHRTASPAAVPSGASARRSPEG